MGCACLKSGSAKETKSIFVLPHSSNENRNNNNPNQINQIQRVNNSNSDRNESIAVRESKIKNFNNLIIKGLRQQIRQSANEERRNQNLNQVRLHMNYNPDFNMPELGKEYLKVF